MNTLGNYSIVKVGNKQFLNTKKLPQTNEEKEEKEFQSPLEKKTRQVKIVKPRKYFL